MSSGFTVLEGQNAPIGEGHTAHARSKTAQDPERDVLASRLAYLTVGLPAAGTVAAIAYAIYNGLWVSDVVLFAAWTINSTRAHPRPFAVVLTTP